MPLLRNLPRPVALVLLTLAAACGSSPTGSSNETTGALTVTVAHLPNGTPGAVVVSNQAGYQSTVTSSTVIHGLNPGQYLISASQVIGTQFTFAATAPQQSVVISAGQTRTITVDYAAITGALQVNLSGAPVGVGGHVLVTGPGGYSHLSTLAELLTNLAPGDYTLASTSVNAAGQQFGAAPASQVRPVAVGVVATANVSYTALPPSASFPNLAAGYQARSMVAAGLNLNYQLFIPQGYDPANSYPVILFAHGSGERGSNNTSQLGVGLGPTVTASAATFPAVVIFPQIPSADPPSGTDLSAWANSIYFTALDSALRFVHADSSRIYLTGVSYGAFRTWGMAYSKPDLFAAIAPVAGGVYQVEFGVPTIAQAAALAASRLRALPIWQWNGDADGTVPIATYGYPLRDAFAAFGPPATYHFVVGVGLGHQLEVNYNDPAFWAWLFAQHR